MKQHLITTHTFFSNGLGISFAILLSIFAVSSSGEKAYASTAGAGPAIKYFPLALGNNWVLQAPVGGGQFSFDVISASNNTYRIRSTTPWSTSDWLLTDEGNQFWMTGYGSAAGIQPLSNVVYLDFASPAGTTWTNILGKLTVASQTATVADGGVTLSNCIQIVQGSGTNAITMTFAAGVGLVSYAMGGQVFLLNSSASKLPASAYNLLAAANASSSTLPRVGVVPNAFANEADTLQASMVRVQMLASAGATFLPGYGRWSQLEPTQGNFQFTSLLLQVAEAQSVNLQSGYSFCIIDMANRNVPPELSDLAWSDPVLESRVFTIVDLIARNFGGAIQYFQFGCEVDTYFLAHPSEVSDFAALMNKVRTVVQNRAPGVKVSSTFKFTSLGSLNGYLAPVNQASDLLVLTYGAYNSLFAAENPSVVATDIPNMVLAAGSRKLYIMEIAYPSSTTVGSSEDLQAQFVQNVFTQLRSASSHIAAANFYDLADYYQLQALSLAITAGISSYPNAVGVIESLGMWDVNAQPKKSWQMFTQQATQK
jgi:hypothetical protein